MDREIINICEKITSGAGALCELVALLKHASFGGVGPGALTVVFKAAASSCAAAVPPSASLELLISCHRLGYDKCTTKDFILDRFYRPHEASFRSRYESNRDALTACERARGGSFPEFDSLDRLIIPAGGDGRVCAAYSKRTGAFEMPSVADEPVWPSFDVLMGKRIFVSDVHDGVFLEKLLAATEVAGNDFGPQAPMYLYYSDFERFCENMQIFEYSRVAGSRRTVFLFGESAAVDYFLEPQSWPPEAFVASSCAPAGDPEKLIGKAAKKKLELFSGFNSSIDSYYSNLTASGIVEKIRNGSVRVGIITSRFTTAIQFFARDSYRALLNLGLDARLLVDESDIRFLCPYAFKAFYADFKPDVVLVIDHFRWENYGFHENGVFVCWIADFLQELLSRASAARIGTRDFVISQFGCNAEFKSVGYPSDRHIAGAIPVNSEIYKKYDLSPEEAEKYSADVCVISNSGNARAELEKLLSAFSARPSFGFVKKIFEAAYDRIFGDIYNGRAEYYSTAAVRTVLAEEFDCNRVSIRKEDLEKIVFEFRINVVASMYKLAAVRWLCERGYKIKLWGRAWTEMPVFAPYAMGIAPNGEGMSKILNASKITVGSNIAVTLHPRVMEAILSGCLYIGNAIPPADEWTDVRGYLRENEEVLLYYSRDDLYEKIDRYLADEDGRKRIVDAGAAVIREKLTYEVLMRNMLDRIADSLSAK